MRATSDLALEHVTVPHKSSATSSNRYINGRSAYSAGTGDELLIIFDREAYEPTHEYAPGQRPLFGM